MNARRALKKRRARWRAFVRRLAVKQAGDHASQFGAGCAGRRTKARGLRFMRYRAAFERVESGAAIVDRLFRPEASLLDEA